MQKINLTFQDLSPPKETNGHKTNGHAPKSAKTRGKIVHEYDYRDAQGKVVYQVCRFDPKDFRQRRPDGKDGWIWNLKDVERVLYRLPELLASQKPVFVVEGEKDTDRLSSMGLIATTNAQGAGKWQDSFSEQLVGRAVVIVPDNDVPGRKHAGQVALSLYGKAKAIKIVALPGLPDKGDVSDWLDAGGAIEQLKELLNAAPLWMPPSNASESQRQDDRAEIVISTDEVTVNDAAIQALARDDKLYQRAGRLVHVVTSPARDGIDRPEDAPRILPFSLPGLRERLTCVAQFVTIHESKEGAESKPAHPPKWCYEAIAARGQWSGIRSLAGVVTAPVLRPDGTVLNLAGYDAATGLLFDSQGVSFPIIERPTHDDAVRAAASLMDLVADFPFRKPDHRAAWLAFLLTPLARFAFTGPAPLFLIDANVRGSGKSLLCDMVALIVTGSEMSRMANPKDDDEARKRITALALAGDTLCLIDNIVGGLGCASLDAALTGTVWKDRVLGKSEIVELPLSVTWSATGNNVVLHADTSRRVAHIRLDSRLENPEQREGFRHPNLKAYIRSHRPQLLAHVLTILAAFCHAGRPQRKLPTWGSFEDWSDLVRQAVVWSGQSDPGATRTELVEQSDREAVALRELLGGWDELDPDCFGLTTAEILDRINKHHDRYERVRNAVLELCPPQAGHSLPSAGSFGKKLGHLRGRVVSGRYIDRRSNRKKTSAWFVSGETAGDDGDAGDISSPLTSDIFSTSNENLYGVEPKTSPATPASPATDPQPDDVEVF